MGKGIIVVVIAFVFFMLLAWVSDPIVKSAAQNATGLEQAFLETIQTIIGIPTDLGGIAIKAVFWICALAVGAKL